MEGIEEDLPLLYREVIEARILNQIPLTDPMREFTTNGHINVPTAVREIAAFNRIINSSEELAAAAKTELEFPPFTTRSFHYLAEREVADRLWTVDNLIPEGTITGLWGRGGIGKTMLALQLAECVSNGESFMGKDVHQGGVLMMLNEDDCDEVARRVQRISAASPDALVMDIDDLADPCLVRFDRNSDAPMLTPAFHRLSATVEHHRPALLVLDPLSYIYGGADVSKEQVVAFVWIMRTLCSKYGVTILLIGHPSKDKESEFSGSEAWNSSVRSRLLFKKDEDGELFTLTAEKANYGKADGLEVKMVQNLDGYFLPANLFNIKKEKKKSETDRKKSADSMVLNFCISQAKCGGVIPTRSTNGYGAHGVMKNIDSDIVEGFTPTELAGSMTRLVNAKALVERQIKTPSRHKKTILWPAGVAYSDPVPQQ